jgi:hypothetical protein
LYRKILNAVVQLDRLVGAKLCSLPYGLAEYLAASLRLSINSLSADKGHLKKYRYAYEHGYERLSSVIDADYLAYLKAMLQEAIAVRDPRLNLVKEGDALLSEALRFKLGEPELEEFQRVFSKSPTSGFLYGVMMGPFELVELILWRNYHLPSELRSGHHDYYSATWHTDGCPADFAKIFINLQDVDSSHGPTFVASKEESKCIIRLGYRKRNEYAKAANAIRCLETSPENIMTGKEGDGFYLSPACCLHRAGIPERGRHRELLMLIARPKVLNGWLSNPRFYLS